MWYAIVRHMPEAWGCDAELRVIEEVQELDDYALFGSYDPGANVITVAVVGDPYETLATLIHEIAHYAANPRHQRHHGYSWRRCYVELVRAITGVDPLPVAREYRSHRPTTTSKQAALDVGAHEALTRSWHRIRIENGRVTATRWEHVIGRAAWPDAIRSLPDAGG